MDSTTDSGSELEPSGHLGNLEALLQELAAEVEKLSAHNERLTSLERRLAELQGASTYHHGKTTAQLNEVNTLQARLERYADRMAAQDTWIEQLKTAFLGAMCFAVLGLFFYLLGTRVWP